MTYMLAVKMTAKEGEEEAVRDWLVKVSELTRQEPGCLSFQPHRDTTDPRVFFVYEQFVDKAAHSAHLETEHFKAIAEKEIMTRADLELYELAPC